MLCIWNGVVIIHFREQIAFHLQQTLAVKIQITIRVHYSVSSRLKQHWAILIHCFSRLVVHDGMGNKRYSTLGLQVPPEWAWASPPDQKYQKKGRTFIFKGSQPSWIVCPRRVCKGLPDSPGLAWAPRNLRSRLPLTPFCMETIAASHTISQGVWGLGRGLRNG